MLNLYSIFPPFVESETTATLPVAEVSDELCFADSQAEKPVLNAEQTKAINEVNGKAIISAGPGTGKSTLLIARMKEILRRNPKAKILMISFTRKSASELKERIGLNDNVVVSTFHSLAYKILLSSEYQNFKVTKNENYARSVISKLIGKHDDVSVDDVIKGLFRPSSVTQAISEIREKFIKKLEQNRIMTFDALQLVALRLLIKCKSSLRYWQKKYDYILVDEYQDVDENQAELLELLSASNGNVTVVGDQRQGIYSFRGSLSDSMEKFAVNAKQYELSINHRNNAAILGLGNQVMNMYTPLVSALYNAKVNYPLYALASNVTAEAKMITSEIKRLNKKGYKFSDIAILYRSGNLAIHIVDELIERNIPISMKSAVSSQYSKMPMRGLIDLFTYALLPCAKTFVAIKPILYLKHTAKTISSFDDVKKANIPFFQRDYIDSMASAIGKIKEKDLSPSKAAEVLLAAGYGKYLGESQKAAADSMVDALLEYDSIPQFLDHVRDVETQTAKIQQASGSTNDAVKLMTIHSSKGLEFKVVFIIGCYDGGLPSAHEGIDMHEERRLLYVAITRAKELLYISWPSLNEKNNEPNEASRFLREAFSMSKI